MNKKYFLSLFIILVSTSFNVVAREYLRVRDFGIESALNGEEKYRILLDVHQKAIEQGKGVSYQGLQTLSIEIPQNPQSIPMPNYTDFAGVTITVTNNQQNFHLFQMHSGKEYISLSKEQISIGDFSAIKELKSGRKVLILEDNNLWVRQRIGYDLGVTRKDILYLKNGRAINSPVQSYNTESTDIKTYWFNGSSGTKEIKNLNFTRSEDSSKETYLIKIDCQDNVKISNITVLTPQSDMYADILFAIYDCSNIVFDNIIVNGTYSKQNQYGYAFYMNNVWNSTFTRLKAKGDWGVFGNYNINKIAIKDSDINRFDIHCYGKDVTLKRCIIRDLYNQFSSIYGKIKFESCTFYHAIPLLMESSYNAYTPFEVEWNKCIFHLDKEHNYIITLFGVPKQKNERPELQRKNLPNVTINRSKVFLADDVDKWYLIKTEGNNYKDSFDYMNIITLKGVKVYGGSNSQFILSTEQLETTQKLKVDVRIKEYNNE